MKNIIITPKIKKDKFGVLNFTIEKNWFDFFKTKKVNLIATGEIIDQKKDKLLNVNGLIIHGGNDLPSVKNNHENFLRKKNNISLIKFALKKKIPILAVCYGFQLIADMYGYKVKKSDLHVKLRHKLDISTFYEKQVYLNVNSYHNYVVYKLPSFFNKIIKHYDGSIELALSKSKKIICTMFHPERKNIKQNKIKKIIYKHFNI